MIKQNPNPRKYAAISKAVNDNDGYCCCEIVKTPDTRCICKKFRDSVNIGFCDCGRYYKIYQYGIITLCGSTRFKKEFIQAQKDWTLQGWIVLSANVFGHSGDELTDAQKEDLDYLHKAKIEMSDAIFVINKGGYIGESTASEIEWAKALGKEIYYLEDPD